MPLHNRREALYHWIYVFTVTVQFCYSFFHCLALCGTSEGTKGNINTLQAPQVWQCTYKRNTAGTGIIRQWQYLDHWSNSSWHWTPVFTDMQIDIYRIQRMPMQGSLLYRGEGEFCTFFHVLYIDHYTLWRSKCLPASLEVPWMPLYRHLLNSQNNVYIVKFQCN